jgi:acyl carrier protein
MQKTFTEISDWITAHISKHAEIEPSEITLDTDIVNFRLDSLLLVNITTDLEEWLGMELSPSIFWARLALLLNGLLKIRKYKQLFLYLDQLKPQ